MLVAYRIETPRLVIRCPSPTDAPLLHATMLASLDHLREWLRWASTREPMSLDDRVEQLRQWRGKFDLDQERVYLVFSKDEREIVGGTGLHARVGPRATEIGYWVGKAHLGKGFAQELTAALVRVAMELHECDRVEVHCDVKNDRSANVPRKLGFTLDATLRARSIPASPDAPMGDSLVFSILKDELGRSPMADKPVRAFDAAGRTILAWP